ncbi:MAG: (Fe-S)-binding protein [Opitutales bacterium]
MPPSLQSLDYRVLQQCMHCGLCLPTCPTFVETGRERHSPRGRIALMRAVADGALPVTQGFGEEMYDCLGCLACQSACPAGVDYVTLLEAARADVEQSGVLDSAQPRRRFWRTLGLRVVFTRPRLLRACGRLLRFWQRSGLRDFAARLGLLRLLPADLRKLEPSTPRIADRFSPQLIRAHETPPAPRYRVGLLTGCIQDLVFSSVNRDTADVLLAHGCAVFTPRIQPCCGSLHAHNGEPALAAALARRLLDLFDLAQLDAVITNAGGCGSHLKHFSALLADDPAYAARARQWDAKVRDIHEWLAHIGLVPVAASAPSPAITVTYHESCHLCHGQKISAAPRAVLRAVPGAQLVELRESDWCCGSAGLHSITHPDQAAKLLQRKLMHVAATSAAIVATANPGCQLQLENGLRSRGSSAPRVTHPVSLLAAAYRAAGQVPQ